MRMLSWVLVFALSSVLVSVACQPEIVPEPYVPTDAHDGYRHSLVASGLGETALGRDWQEAGDAALRSPVGVETPFKETVYVDRRAQGCVTSLLPIPPQSGLPEP